MPQEPAPPPDWDARYAEPGWAFGSEPNDFLREAAVYLPAHGRVLCLAEGEGRNAVHLAGLGHDVLGVDLSSVGLAKAHELAASRGVRIRTQVADLAEFAIEPESWDAIVSIFAHLPPVPRARMHANAVRGLRPGGVFVLEAYRPEQVGAGTGGPSDPGKLVTLALLDQELGPLEWLVRREIERDVIEGRYHSGRSSVVQLVGRKPA